MSVFRPSRPSEDIPDLRVGGGTFGVWIIHLELCDLFRVMFPTASINVSPSLLSSSDQEISGQDQAGPIQKNGNNAPVHGGPLVLNQPPGTFDQF